MSELLEQLQELRARVARINQKYPSPVARETPQAISGNPVETAFGTHFERETLYPAHARHGSAAISELADLSPNLFETLSGGSVSNVPPSEWAFLDTETTGLAGGTGTCAFLVGVGRIEPEGFRVRQFFMRDYDEEASQLDALTKFLEPCRVLVTYNGKAYDQPLLETRYRLNRARPPFARMEHVDLLFGAGGGEFLYNQQSIQRSFRDVHAANSHYALAWDIATTMAGKSLLGIAADSPTL